MTRREARPETVTRCLLVLFLTGICSRGYGFYGQTLKYTPQVWMDVVRGTASAPEQYRIGVVAAAHWISVHVGGGSPALRMSRVFGIFDLVGSVAAALLLYGLLERTEIYRQSGTAMRWFGSAAFLALTIYAVDWTNWYQKVGTLPTAGIVALMVWLWSPRGEQTAAKMAGAAVGILVLVVVQSLIRADIALVLCLGVLVASVLRLGQPLGLTRGAAIATSVLGVALAVGVQLYLMKVRYPQAGYRGVPVVMLPYDYLSAALWVSTLIYLAPLLWAMTMAVRQRRFGEGMSAALLLSAGAYAVLWICMGRLDEVRIFLPMALAVVPLTVEMAMRRVAEAGGEGVGGGLRG